MSSPSPSPQASPAVSEQSRSAESPGSAQESLLDADITHYVSTEDSGSTGNRVPSDTSSDEDWGSPPFTQVPNHGASQAGTDAHDSGTNDFLSPSQQRGALVEAMHTANRLKLHPYQVARVKTFVMNPWSSQLAETFCEVLALGNKLDQVILQQPCFTVDTVLAKTVRLYTLGVVLSEKLCGYKGNTPINHIFTIIAKQQINVPSNLSKNPFAQEVIKSHIGNELMQLRSAMKKAIKKSIDKDWSIYQLATNLVEGSPCKVCIPLCVRLAVMCKVYTDLLPSPETTNFWDAIDACLEYFRTKVNNNADAIRKILSGTLKDDRMKYGALETIYDIPEEGGDFEQGIADNM